MLYDNQLMQDDSSDCTCRAHEVDDGACPGEDLHTAGAAQARTCDDSIFTASMQNGKHHVAPSTGQVPSNSLEPDEVTTCPSNRQSTGQSLEANSHYDEPLDDRAWQSEAYALEDARSEHLIADQMHLGVAIPPGAQSDTCTPNHHYQQQQWHEWDADEYADDWAQDPNDTGEQQNLSNLDSQKFLRKTSRKQNMWRLPDYSLVKPRTNCHLEPHFKPAALAGYVPLFILR